MKLLSMLIFFPLPMNKLHKSIRQLIASGASPLVVVFAVDKVDLKFSSLVQQDLETWRFFPIWRS